MSELLIALVVAWIYLTLVRFLDLNEREPVWALAVVFLLGAVGAFLADLLLGSAALIVPRWGGALAVETTRFFSLAAGILVLNGVARIRGWSEFSDWLDGLVYGIAVGLGYSTGETFLRELHTAQFVSLHLLQTPFQALVRAAASGLSHGVFGGIVGLGWAGALEGRSRLTRSLSPLLGLGAAVLLDVLFRGLAHGNTYAGQPALFRAWLAVLLPIGVFIGIGLLSLTAERRAIHAHLAALPDASLVSSADLELLESFWRRQMGYLALLLRGRVGTLLHLAARHNRQVQLALLLGKITREPDPVRRTRLLQQAELVRGAIRHAKALALIVVVLLAGGCKDPAPAPAPPALPEPAPAPPASPESPASAVPLDSMIALARVDLDAYWAGQLGAFYRSPEDVTPYSDFSLECPRQEHNARWCRGERKIYYDPVWFESFRSEAGDFAPVFVIAHEWGHLVQDHKGDLDPKVGLWPVQIELQADCYAGQWTRDATGRRAIKSASDDQAVLALRRLRDPVDYPWFASDAHGDAGQRINAFLEGVDGHSCSGANFWKRVHADPQASLQVPTPPSGSLISSLACRAGRFARESVFQWPEALSTVVTDAIQATFKTPDGVTVSYWSMVLVSQPAAQARLESFLEQAFAKGFKVAKEGPVNDAQGRQIGMWKLLEGLAEIVVIRNGQKITAYEGPAGAAWEFGTAKTEFVCN